MKKKILTICLMVVLAISALGGFTAFANVSLEECDRCFQTTVNGFLDADDVEGNKVTALKKPVYDINLRHLGYVYEFEIVGGSGYAIIICDEGNYIAQEFVPHSVSPYASVSEEELCVYINSMTYLKFNGALFYDIVTSTEVPAEVLDSLAQNAIQYKDNNYYVPETMSVTVNYTSCSSNYKYLSPRIPHFLNNVGLEGACAAVAGTNIIGFYDRYYENLIPNHVAGVEAYGYYMYNLVDTYVYDAMKELYADMSGTSAGITETNFKNGMQKYCARKNLTCDFTSLLVSGKLSYDAVKQSIEENKPIALLLSTFNVCDLEGYSGYDKHLYNLYYGDHIMAGFGYCELTYQLTSGGSANYKYVYVASGLVERNEGYFNVNYSTNINAAYKVYIH